MLSAFIVMLLVFAFAIFFWGSILVAFFYGIRLLIKWFKKKYDEL